MNKSIHKVATMQQWQQKTILWAYASATLHSFGATTVNNSHEKRILRQISLAGRAMKLLWYKVKEFLLASTTSKQREKTTKMTMEGRKNG